MRTGRLATRDVVGRKKIGKGGWQKQQEREARKKMKKRK